MRLRLLLPFLSFFFLCSAAKAQALPLMIGGVLENGAGLLNDGQQGTGVVRITPFVGAWITSIGYIRVGYGLWNYKEKDSTGTTYKKQQRDLSVQAGVALGGADRPYVALSYVRARTLTTLGDSEWNEWGAGVGNRFYLSSYSAFVAEVEYRWIMNHYDREQEIDVSGTRLQLNMGIAVFLY